MELLTIIATCFVLLSFMFAPCASDQVQVKKSLKKAHDAVELNLLPLPRKLKLNEEGIAKSVEEKYFGLYKRNMEASSSTPGNKLHQKEKNLMHPGKGTWKKWTDHQGAKKSEYFTMDYGWVRRRRPIHNKHVPVGP
ncbi:putative root meristem growth factor 8 [Forsythia ovata]|uniref:Root meristem growth factor 8 n=1 Tax=Forsythia ovata TaxID=205694 RepID=A0ABD1XB11_9LAMI